MRRIALYTKVCTDKRKDDPVPALEHIYSKGYCKLCTKTDNYILFPVTSFIFVLIFVGFASYLRQVHNVAMPPNPLWNCKIANIAVSASMMFSTLFILCMTFERFYSIIQPHKAASFNTVKRAKITIVVCVIIGFLFNIPHLFFSIHQGVRCIPHSVTFRHAGIHYWLSFVLYFLLPFIFLLTMNIVIIHTLRMRFSKNFIRFESSRHSLNRDQKFKMKNTEKQIYHTLLLITFWFSVLTTPTCVLKVLVYASLIVYGKTPRQSAVYFFLYHVAQKSFYTNNGINFFFYVMSGQKFRTDLVNLLRCYKDKGSDKMAAASDETIVSYAAWILMKLLITMITVVFLW